MEMMIFLETVTMSLSLGGGLHCHHPERRKPLYYDLRYRPQGQTGWTGEERLWLPEGVVMQCNSTTDEFSCDYVGRWSKVLGGVKHDIEIRARNANGHGPWQAVVSAYTPGPIDGPRAADANSPTNLAVESHYGIGISTVKWDAPTSGGTVTEYVVQWEEAATGTVKRATLSDAAARSYDIGGKWLARWVRVAAITSNGTAYSKDVFAPDDPVQVWFGEQDGDTWYYSQSYQQTRSS